MKPFEQIPKGGKKSEPYTFLRGRSFQAEAADGPKVLQRNTVPIFKEEQRPHCGYCWVGGERGLED